MESTLVVLSTAHRRENPTLFLELHLRHPIGLRSPGWGELPLGSDVGGTSGWPDAALNSSVACGPALAGSGPVRVSSPEVGVTSTTTDQWVRNFSPEVGATFHRRGCN